jgi:hypothetical protein
MLQLPALASAPIAGTCFADSSDAAVLYRLPDALTVATDANGDPDFVLARYRDEQETLAGGLLRAQLRWAPLTDANIETALADGRSIATVPLDGCRARMQRRVIGAGTGSALGPWQPGLTDSAVAVTIEIALSSGDAQLAEQLLTSDTDILEIEVEGRYRGIVSGHPWLAHVDSGALLAQLGPLLANAAADFAHIVVAMQTLVAAPDTPVVLTALAPDAQPLTPDLLGQELAHRTLDTLFVASGANPAGEPTYTLVATAASLSVDLLVPRQETQFFSTVWSISELYATLDDPAHRSALFPTVEPGEPFASVEIPVLCEAQFDPVFLRSVEVTLRWTGATGTPVYHQLEFTGSAPTQRLDAVYPSVTNDLALAMKVRSTIAGPPGSWPTVVEREFEPLPRAIAIVDDETLGLVFVRAEADPSLFADIDHINLAIEAQGSATTTTAAATVTLTAASTGHWVALQIAEQPATINVTADAIAASGTPSVRIYTGAITDRRLVLNQGDLLPIEWGSTSIRLAEGAQTRLAYAAVTVAPEDGNEQTHTLDGEQPITVALRRESIFTPFRFRYRLDLVGFDDHHATLPLITTEWTDATSDGASDLILDPQLPTPSPA